MGDNISLSEAKTILGSRMGVLTTQLRLTIEMWNSRPASWQVSLDSKTRGMFVNRHWYHGVQTALSDDPMVRRIKDSGAESYFVIENSFALRFKHLGRNLMSMNYPTKRAQDWNRQLRLPGLPPWDRLEFGYRMDITGTTIRDAFVLLRKGGAFLWIWQVMGHRIDTFPVQRQLPFDRAEEPLELVAYSNYGAYGSER